MATAHTGRLFSSWKLDSNLNNTSTCWKIRPKTRRKKSLHRAIWSGNIEPESIKQHPLFFFVVVVLAARKRRPPGDFIATVSLSVPHFWAGEGGGVGFLFWEPLQLCVAGEENGLFSDNSNPRLNKGQASSLLGPVGVLYLQLKYWDALCQNVKKEKHSGEIKKWGHGCYYKVESFPAGFISAKCNLLSCWNEWGTK